MPYIITGRKTSIKTGKPVFHAHFNRSLCDRRNPEGKYISSEREYRRELDKKNLIPQHEARKSLKNPDDLKPYKPSKWALDMAKASIRSNGSVGSSFINQLEKKGINIKSMEKNHNRAKQILAKGTFDA